MKASKPLYVYLSICLSICRYAEIKQEFGRNAPSTDHRKQQPAENKQATHLVRGLLVSDAT